MIENRAVDWHDAAILERGTARLDLDRDEVPRDKPGIDRPQVSQRRDEQSGAADQNESHGDRRHDEQPIDKSRLATSLAVLPRAARYGAPSRHPCRDRELDGRRAYG